MSFGESVGSICMDNAEASSDLTYGQEVLDVQPGSQVELNRLSLQGAEGVELREAFTTPAGTQTLVGLGRGWPPPEAASWPPLTPFQGARLSGDEGQANLLVHLAVTAQTASFEGLRLDYVANGRRYFATSNFSFRLGPDC